MNCRKRGSMSFLIFSVILVLLLTQFSAISFAGDNNWEESLSTRVLDAGYITIVGIGIGDINGDGVKETIAAFDKYIDKENANATLVIYDIKDGQIEEMCRFYGFSMLLYPGFMTQGIYRIITADIDGDGDKEIIAHGKYDEITGIHIFDYANGSIKHIGLLNENDVDAYDVNGDGADELISSSLVIYKYESKSFQKLGNGGGSRLWGASYVRVGNFTGSWGVVTINYDETRFFVYNKSTEKFDSQGSCISDNIEASYLDGIAVGDFDGDGLDEVFLCDYHNHYSVTAYSSGSFSTVEEGSFSTEGNSMFATSGDFDGDNVDEIAVSFDNYVYVNILKIYEYKYGNFTCSYTSDNFDGMAYYVASGDFRNTGKVDVGVGSEFRGYLRIFTYLGETTDENPPGIVIIGKPIFNIKNSTLKLRIYDNFGQWGSIVYMDGKFIERNITSYSFSSAEEGNHTLKVVAYDSAGNRATKTINIMIDMSRPEFRDNPEVNIEKVNNKSIIHISWDAYDSISGIDHYEINIDNQGWKEIGKLREYIIYNPSYGKHTVKIKAVDGAMNERIISAEFNISPPPDYSLIMKIVYLSIISIVIAITLFIVILDTKTEASKP